jgi:hypothetical protein
MLRFESGNGLRWERFRAKRTSRIVKKTDSEEVELELRLRALEKVESHRYVLLKRVLFEGSSRRILNLLDEKISDKHFPHK